VLPLQVTVTLLTFIAASCIAILHGCTLIAGYHIIFAVGVVPLIFCAMIHFLPVLARSKSPGKFIHMLPVLALIGGVLLTSYLMFPQKISLGHYLGAAITIVAVGCLGIWTFQVRAKAIDAPHPCLNWYLASMGCLFIALCAILLEYLIPASRGELRLVHIHLNTLGFIGIAALATLQVLLPTIAKRFDPVVATRMHNQLKWVVSGTMVIAFSAAWMPNFAWIGVLLLAMPLLGILKSWSKLYLKEIFKVNDTASALAVALCGYATALAVGTAHAYSHPDLNPVAIFIISFLMPLVTGAVSYLLPLWVQPGKQMVWHQKAQKHLGFAGGLRALILLVGGVGVSLGYEMGWYLAIFVIGAFFLQALLLYKRIFV